MEDEALTPVLRITDAEAAIAWYKRLGFVVDSEWSSGPTFRETMAVVRRGDLALILSSREKGLSRSDSLLCFRVADLTPFEQEFNSRQRHAICSARAPSVPQTSSTPPGFPGSSTHLHRSR